MFHTHTPPGGDFFECEAEQKVRSKDGDGSLCTHGSASCAQFSKEDREVKKSVWREVMFHLRVNRIDVRESLHGRSSRSSQSFGCLCTKEESGQVFRCSGNR